MFDWKFSVGIRECSFRYSVANIGDRQSGRLRGKNVVDVDYDKEEIVQAIKHQLKSSYNKEKYMVMENLGKKLLKFYHQLH